MAAPYDDHTLLKAWSAGRDETAFAELVARHADMVYAAALRQVGRNDLAEDVTQAAFILLARKGSRISRGVVVAAWLYKATRYAALNAMKIERRRKLHEHEAGQQLAAEANSRIESATAIADVNWSQGAALLDEGVARLGDKERAAVVLRFLEKRSYADVGLSLGISEEAAQMRVGRGIEKLRGFFRRHGLTLSAASLRASVNGVTAITAPGSLKLALTPIALRAVVSTPTTIAAAPTSSSNASALAEHVGRSFDLAAARSATYVAAASVAAAVLIAIAIIRFVPHGNADQPAHSQPLRESRAVLTEPGAPFATEHAM